MVQRSGLVNVGLEGMILAGAFAASITAYYTHSPALGIAAALLIGMIMAVLFGIFSIKLHANQVVVGVLLNLLALGVTGALYRILFGLGGNGLQTRSLPLIHHAFTILTPIALLSAPVVWWWLYHTRNGLEMRACGEQPAAAEASGASVQRIRAIAILFGGAMAGVAGAFLSVADTNTFVPNMSAGRGFIALAIVTAGRWNPWGALAAALLFGFANALQFQGQAIGLNSLYTRFLGIFHLTHLASQINLSVVPYQLFLALPYVVTLLLLYGGSRSTLAPAALGRPYRRS